MSKDDVKKTVTKAPLDPTQNMGQMMGDPHGIAGITGSNNVSTDDLNLRNDDPKAFQGMSSTRANRANDIASEDDLTDDTQGVRTQDPLFNTGVDNDLVEADDYQSPLAGPSVQGEQAFNGSMPAPESDDDTLENAHLMGQQLGEDEEHPQELDIARDLDEAEEYLRTH
jgi:hypothetical protein